MYKKDLARWLGKGEICVIITYIFGMALRVYVNTLNAKSHFVSAK